MKIKDEVSININGQIRRAIIRKIMAQRLGALLEQNAFKT